MKNIPMFSLILPIHNEGETIELLIKDILETANKKKIEIEILTVENGSSDNSVEILQRIIKKKKQVRFLQSEKGWGNAVKKGLEKARGECVCYMVSDGQIDPKYAFSLYNLYRSDTLENKKCTIYKVTRLRRENMLRRFISIVYNTFANVLLNVSQNDSNATPKLFSRMLVTSIPLVSSDIGIDIELLYKLKKQSVRVVEIPVQSAKRKHGLSTTNWKSMVDMMQTMLRLRFNKM